MLSESILKSEQQDSCSSNSTTTNSLPIEALEEVEVEVKLEEPKSDVSDELNMLLGDTESEEKTANIITIPAVVIETEYMEKLSFLDAEDKSFTINITTTKGLEAANNFVNKNNLDSVQAYTYEFGPGMKSAKVIYGIFASVKEAKVAIANFPKKLRAAKPYIDNISKHKKLYNKYH
jgi:adhesin transport system outer membrane protein